MSYTPDKQTNKQTDLNTVPTQTDKSKSNIVIIIIINSVFDKLRSNPDCLHREVTGHNPPDITPRSESPVQWQGRIKPTESHIADLNTVP